MYDMYSSIQVSITQNKATERDLCGGTHLESQQYVKLRQEDGNFDPAQAIQ